MKQRNPTWGCPRIAQQIAFAFDIPINKDVVRRILAAHYKPEPDSSGPSWLTFLGHMKDSLWSADLFRCESLILRTHWVLVVMDQCTRRIVGFGIHRGIVDGLALCRMFRKAVQRQPLPKYLSTDNDPLYRFHQWQANLRVLEVTKSKQYPMRLYHIRLQSGSLEQSGENAWTERYFGRGPIWRRSYLISNIFIMDIEHTPGWKDSCPNR